MLYRVISIEVEKSLVWEIRLIWIEAGFCFLFAMALGARSFKIPLVSLLLSSLLTLGFPKPQRRYISALAVSIYYIIPQLCWYDDKVWSGEAFYNLPMKSQSFSEPVTLTYDHHKCSFSSSFPPSQLCEVGILERG